MDKKLIGRVAIVTGGARGIGEGCVRALVEEGAQVVIADIREEEAHRVCEDIRKKGVERGKEGKVSFTHTDVLDKTSISNCVEETIRNHGGLHILVNNAGTHFPHTIDELTPERWDFMLNLNLKSMFLFCKLALPALRKVKGSIINMSSVRGRIGQQNAIAYCASKAGILGFTKGLARDEAAGGVRVNAICPSNIETPLMNEWLENQADPVEMRKQCEQAQPMGRMGSIEEIGRVAAFLAGPDATFITGIEITADGGALLG